MSSHEQPRNALGEFAEIAEYAVEAEGLTEEEAAEFTMHDSALVDGHQDIVNLHNELTAHMEKLKELHAKLGKVVSESQHHLDRMNDLEEKDTGDNYGESEIINSGRSTHQQLGTFLEEHAAETKNMTDVTADETMVANIKPFKFKSA